MTFEFPIKEITGLLYHADKYGYRPYIRYYDMLCYDNNDAIFYNDLLNPLKCKENTWPQTYASYIPLLIENSEFVYRRRSCDSFLKKTFVNEFNNYLNEVNKKLYMFNEEFFNLMFNNCTFVIDCKKWSLLTSLNTKYSTTKEKSKIQLLFLKEK